MLEMKTSKLCVQAKLARFVVWLIAVGIV